jgi:hypothetical protein
MMSDVELPVAHIRAQVAAAIDVIVQLARLRDGRRVVWGIAVVEGTRHGEPIVEPVFRSSLREVRGRSWRRAGSRWSSTPCGLVASKSPTPCSRRARTDQRLAGRAAAPT